MCTTLKRHHRRGTCSWREVARALEKAGFSFARQRASHAIFVHQATGHTVTVLRSGDAKNGTLSKLVREVYSISGRVLNL